MYNRSTIILLLLTVIFFLSPWLNVFAQTPINIDALNPSPNPSIAPSPQISPSPSSTPSPRPSPTPNEPPLKLCDSLVAVAAPAGDLVYLYVSDDFVRRNKPDYMEQLKADPNYSNIANNPEIIDYYRALASKFYYSGQFRLPAVTVIKAQVQNGITELGSKNFPKFPYLILGTMFTYGSHIDGYPMAIDLTNAVNKIGCTGSTPQKSLAFSPIIHTYTPYPQPVSIKLKDPSILSYSDHPYTLKQGFITENNSSIYYEFIQNNIAFANISDENSVVVEKNKLKDYILKQLLPQLNLNDQELNQFLKKDINPQLARLNLSSDEIGQNYKITFLTTNQVNNLIPLTISPSPDLIIRNMIIIKPTIEPLSLQSKKLQTNLINREVDKLIIVENGFILFD